MLQGRVIQCVRENDDTSVEVHLEFFDAVTCHKEESQELVNVLFII